MLGGPERAEFFDKAQPWLSEHSVAEIVELSQAMRIPATPVNDGATVMTCPQYCDRGFFVDAGGEDWSFRRPGDHSGCRRRPCCRYGPHPASASPAQLLSTENDSTAASPAGADLVCRSRT